MWGFEDFDEKFFFLWRTYGCCTSGHGQVWSVVGLVGRVYKNGAKYFSEMFGN